MLIFYVLQLWILHHYIYCDEFFLYNISIHMTSNQRTTDCAARDRYPKLPVK